MPKISPAQEQQRRAQILGAAMACFAREGYHATSMDDVVRESGLSVGATLLMVGAGTGVFVGVAVAVPGVFVGTGVLVGVGVAPSGA